MPGKNKKNRERRMFLSGIALIAIALLLAGALFVKRQSYIRREVRERKAAARMGPEVRVARVKRSSGIRTLLLSGEARPYAQVTLYSKVSGYLKEIMVDKGDHVRAGQIIAVIEAPELDRQYDAALADALNKRILAERDKSLVPQNSISRQDADNAEAAARIAEETAGSLRVQKGYEIMRATFPATVTARFADPGALVQSAVNAQTTALPVVDLSRTDKLRVYVYVDQKDAAFVRVGDAALVCDVAHPGLKLKAAVARTSGQLDPATRTLLVELDLDNKKGYILADSFVRVSLALKLKPHMEVPADALLARGGKDFVAVVAKGNRVDIKPVDIFYSNGKVVQVRSGLKEGQLVVLTPGFGIAENEKVQVRQTVK